MCKFVWQGGVKLSGSLVESEREVFIDSGDPIVWKLVSYEDVIKWRYRHRQGIAVVADKCEVRGIGNALHRIGRQAAGHSERG